MKTHFWAATSVLLAAVAVGCGDDDNGEVDVPEEGTGSAYTQAIIESTSHDEILLPAGDMVVAVDCDPESGGLPVVTAVADGLENGTYVGTFDPSTGTDITLEVTGSGEAVATVQTALDEDTYAVSFDSIEGGTFNVRGC